MLRPGFALLLERPWGKDAYFYICVSGGRLSHCSKASTPPRPQPLHLHVAYSTLVAAKVIPVSLTVGFSFSSWGNCMWMPSIAHHYRFKAHVCVRFSLYLVKRNGGGLWSCQREATSQHLWWLLTQVELGYCISLPLQSPWLTISHFFVSWDIIFTLIAIALPSTLYTLYHRTMGCSLP